MELELLSEKIILKNLIINEDFFVKVFPFLDKDLFTENRVYKIIFEEIAKYNDKYSSHPNISSLASILGNLPGLTQGNIDDAKELFEFCKEDEKYEIKWLLDKTIEFIQSRLYIRAIEVAADKYEKHELDKELPYKLEEALSVNIDSKIGMEFSDAEERWLKYTEQEDKIPFRIDKLNDITNGGLTRKTLNCLLSSNTGGFKSGSMCSFTCDYLRNGYNVLYLSFEMSEDKVMERIDANLLDVNINDIINLGKEAFITRITSVLSKSFGKLVVKQFPTSQCHIGHIKNLLKDLKLMRGFIPDVIVFDYLGIMASQRYKSGEAEHIILKAICEEVRGLCVEYNVIGWTAMQSNRSGSSAGVDLSLSDISSSFATTFGFDLVWGLITSPEYDADHKLMIRQLKSRYGDINFINRFFLNMNKPKMRLSEYVNTNNIDSYEVAKNTDDSEKNTFNSLMKASGSTFSGFGKSGKVKIDSFDFD